MDVENSSNNQSSLKVTPENINFGSLKPGEGGNVGLTVSGGPGEVLVRNNQINVAPSTFGKEDIVLQITLSPGATGELLWDNIMVTGVTEQLSVLITARWEEQPTKELVAVQTSPRLLPKYQSNREWKGRRCSRCNKNFGYNTNIGKWEQCNCNFYERSVNMSKRTITDLRLGISEIPSYLREIWMMVLGKEKM